MKLVRFLVDGTARVRVVVVRGEIDGIVRSRTR